jgi:hypothetical protein
MLDKKNVSGVPLEQIWRRVTIKAEDVVYLDSRNGIHRISSCMYKAGWAEPIAGNKIGKTAVACLSCYPLGVSFP